MSTSDATAMDEHSPQNKPKRACDVCRRRKRRCDGGERCSHCIKFSFACTYVEPALVRNVGHIYNAGELSDSYDTDYVNELELRLKTAEESLRQMKNRPTIPPLHVTAIRAFAKPFTPPHPGDSEFADIADSFRALSLDSEPSDPGFQGKSSAAMLVKAAVAVKSGSEHQEPQIRYRAPLAPEPWMKPWENHLIIPPHTLSFPANRLLNSLISLYFSNVNPFIPVLHRPTFEECVNQRLHMRHLGFGTTLLLVSALGSLYLTEPGLSSVDREKLAWKWYNQVELCGHSLRHPPTIYDIQAYCLATQFLQCASSPRSAWLIAGFGARLAQDVGLHRHKFKALTNPGDGELERRAFWVLSFLDTQLSGATGRSAVLDPVEMDVTLPCECDDEYWDHSGPGFQPRNKPSTISFFNCLFNLFRMLHFVLRSLYTIRLNNIRMQRTHHMSSIAAEFDSALDKWLTSIPKHLIWDPERADALFFDQSAALYCFYYYTRILVHRPFIPGLSSLIQSDPRALGICTEAARACICVADTQRRRRPNNPLFFSQNPVFTAAMILIINERSHPHEPRNPTDDLAHVFTSIGILKAQQERWPSSGIFVTMLERLISLDPRAAQQFTDHRVRSGTEASIGRESQSQFVSNPATPSWMDASSNSNWPPSQHPAMHARPSVAIPPAFVGDEEILPRTVHRPRVIPGDLFRN